jgi:tRNA (guanine9-N1)-methyltransferase
MEDDKNEKINLTSDIPIFNDTNLISNITQPLSKNMLKKLKRKQDWESKKKEIKKFKKDKIKEKKKKNKQENPIEINPIQPIEPVPYVEHIPRKIKAEIFQNKINSGIILIIDCGFENLMNEKDIISLVQQIAFCYSVNRKAEKPFNFIIYDVGDLVMGMLNKNNVSKWTAMKIIKKGEFKTIDEFILNFTNNEVSRENIVYLSADSENETNDLLKSQVYIVGGIVDRNRFKMITYNKAKELGINHGKLPIGEYIHLNSSKVMTTNHVFSILSHYHSVEQNWKNAFMSIIPQRKLNEGKDNEDSDEN